MKAAKTETAVTSTENSTTYNASEWGNIAIESKDLIIPKILIQQSMSEAVKQKTAEEGDLLNTLTNENLGKEIELLPFYKTEHIVVEKYNGRKFEFSHILPYEGKTLPYEEEIAGIRYKNSNVYNIFCLTDSMSMPHILSFKGTSYKIGKQLVSLMYVSNPAEKLTPAGKFISFSAKTETSKSGDMYQVSAFKPTKKSTPEEVKECLRWIGILRNTSFTAAEEAESTPTNNESDKF